MESPFLARDQALSLWSRSADSKTLDCQRTPKPREVSNSENSHKGNHLYTRCSITQVPVAPCAGRLIQTTKIKIQTKSSATRNITLLSPTPQKKKKKKKTYLLLQESTGHTLHDADASHWTNLIRAVTKRKKEFDLEAWK